MATITGRDFDKMAKLAHDAHWKLAQWTAEGNENRDSIDDVTDAEDALASLCGAFRTYQRRSETMSDLKVGMNVEVLDPGLAMLRRLVPDAKPNHHGTIQSIEPDGTIMVAFPIGDDDPDGHSQVAPYDAAMVRPRITKEQHDVSE